MLCRFGEAVHRFSNTLKMTPFKHCLSALLLAGTALFFAACGSVKNVSYLQDIQPGVPIQVQEARQLALQPGDRLRITVFSRDRELTELFNLSNSYTSGGASSTERHPYTVRTDGTIEMPTLGSIRVQGLTRQEVADQIKYKLLTTKLLLDPGSGGFKQTEDSLGNAHARFHIQ